MFLMNRRHALSFLIVGLTIALPLPSLAAGDHDHGASPALASPAWPRFAAESEAFELVGVLQGKQLTLYLDRPGDNSPVRDAKLELDVGGAKVEAKPRGEGEFTATLAEEPKVGVTAVTATVTAGSETDLLAGEIDIHEASHDHASATSWKSWTAGAGGVLALLALMAWAVRRRKNKTEQQPGVAA